MENSSNNSNNNIDWKDKTRKQLTTSNEPNDWKRTMQMSSFSHRRVNDQAMPLSSYRSVMESNEFFRKIEASKDIKKEKNK